MHDTAAILLDKTDEHVADEICEIAEANGDARLTDLHIWQICPQARAAIVSVSPKK